MYRLGRKSLSNLIGVNPILSFAVTEAIKISEVDFGVYEGLRTLKRQRRLVRNGSSWTLRSNHITGNAVDLVVWKDGRYQWDGLHREYLKINQAMKTIIEKHDLPIEWGYDLWNKDLAHYQVNRHKQDGYNINKLSRR